MTRRVPPHQQESDIAEARCVSEQHNSSTMDVANKERNKASPATASSDWWTLRVLPPPSPGQNRLCSLLWQAWVICLIAGSALLLDCDVKVYIGFVTAAFFATAFIPDSGDSSAPYFLHLAIPFFVVKGLREGGGWTAMGFYWAFVLLPLSDIVVGVDTFNKREEEYNLLCQRIGFQLASWIFIPTQIGFLMYACNSANTVDMTPLEQFGFFVSVGVYTGGLGITISHELIHKTNRLEQWLGRTVCVVVCYGHFYVEHTRGHHKLVGTEADPATAKFGESFYSFLPRSIFGGLTSAWRLEVDRCSDRNLPYWHNEMLWYWTASACLCGLLAATFGLKAIPLFLVQSSIAILLFESVNYIEHYGLERQQDKEGKMEPVGVEHSWDAPHRLTNMVLFKLQRHADHHIHSTRRYHILHAEPIRSPQLPMGYPGCILLALFPPLWRAVMDKRVLQLRSKHHGEERTWRHGPCC